MSAPDGVSSPPKRTAARPEGAYHLRESHPDRQGLVVPPVSPRSGGPQCAETHTWAVRHSGRRGAPSPENQALPGTRAPPGRRKKGRESPCV